MAAIVGPIQDRVNEPFDRATNGRLIADPWCPASNPYLSGQALRDRIT
jgi:hypothetical protein